MADTDGRRVAFTQLEGTGDAVVLYDLATQSSTRIPGALNRDPVVGGNIVAFDHGNYGASEIDIYDQSSGNVTPLTADALLDQSPAVSPDGTVVVWEKCQADLTGCDIYSAIRDSAGGYTTRLLTGSGEDRFPDTNGDIVVYVSNKSGENDLYFQRVGGSTEMHLAIPGDQVDPHISGDLIVFLSQVDGEYDVFMYDLHSATLYQVTNTPQVREQYVDIVVGCNGTNRIVYAIPGSGSSDVYEFSFQLSDSIGDQLNDLIALVQSFNLHDGTEVSLISKLEDARTALSVSDTATACDPLTAFINASQAQTGKKLTADQVKLLVDSAAQIKTGLGCQ